MSLKFEETKQVMRKITILIAIFAASLSLFGQTVSTLVSEFPGDGELSFDAAGNLYINDSGEGGVLNGDKVYKVTPAGDTSLFHSGLPVWVVGSIFDQNENLLVTGWQAGEIARISSDGSSFSIVAAGISGAGSLEIAENGNIYVAEYMTHKVLRFDSNGTNRTDYAAGIPIRNPAGLAYVEATKKLYVSNWTNNKICVIDSNQNVWAFAEIPDPSVGPIKIFGGYLFATSPTYHKIYKIRLSDSTDVQLFAGTGTKGNTDGPATAATFDTPTGIGTLDGETFYVAETYGGTGRLRIIEDVFLGLPETSSQQPLSVFPNPASEALHISYPYRSSGNLNILLYSHDGKKIGTVPFSKTGDTIACDLSGIVHGIYFVKVADETGILFSEPFIKH